MHTCIFIYINVYIYNIKYIILELHNFWSVSFVIYICCCFEYYFKEFILLYGPKDCVYLCVLCVLCALKIFIHFSIRSLFNIIFLILFYNDFSGRSKLIMIISLNFCISRRGKKENIPKDEEILCILSGSKC